MSIYFNRTLETFLKKASQQFPALLITGPRQVGKSTLLQHLSEKNRTYITLDDPILTALAKQEPKLFLERFPPPVLIDEIQYAPELLPFVKMHIDQHQIPGQFWFTGSQQFALMNGVSESLAGRIGVVNLLGLSLAERQKDTHHAHPFLPTPEYLKTVSHRQTLSLQKIYETIWRGSFPQIALHAFLDRDLFYGSYVQTYLQRDVRDLTHVRDISTFLKFLRATAARTAQLLNLTELSRDCGISTSTAKQWLSILQASGIIYLLEPYHSNLTKRLIKTPKLYFLDTGLCCYLTEWSSPQTLEAGALSGAILETFAVSEVIKSYWYNGKQAPIYFYRDKDAKEIDLLIVQDQTIYPVEIKKTAAPYTHTIRHFDTLIKLGLPIGHGGLLCCIDKMLPMNDRVTAIPIGML